jgi:hypothetical protein
MSATGKVMTSDGCEMKNFGDVQRIAKSELDRLGKSTSRTANAGGSRVDMTGKEVGELLCKMLNCDWNGKLYKYSGDDRIYTKAFASLLRKLLGCISNNGEKLCFTRLQLIDALKWLSTALRNSGDIRSDDRALVQREISALVAHNSNGKE